MLSGSVKGGRSDAGAWGSQDEWPARASTCASRPARPLATHHVPGCRFASRRLRVGFAARSFPRHKTPPTGTRSAVATAQTPRSPRRSLAVPTLQPTNRADISPLGQAVHLLPQCPASRRDGRAGDQRLSDPSRGQGAGERLDAEPGAQRLLFLYRHVLGRPIGDSGRGRPGPASHRLPVVLTRAEVKAVLGHLTGDKWLMASLMYGAGLSHWVSSSILH